MGNIFKCCGKTAKPGVRIVAYVDIIFALLLVVGAIVAGAVFPGVLLPGPASNAATKYSSSPNIVGLLLMFTFFFLECCFCNLLRSAIKNRNPAQCDNWIKLRIILLCLFIFALVYWMMGAKSLLSIGIVGGIGLAYVLYRVYTLMVVKTFQNEVSKKIQELELHVPLQKI